MTSREYKRYPQSTAIKLNVRHGHETDNVTRREAIRRPVDSAPRRAKEWR